LKKKKTNNKVSRKELIASIRRESETARAPLIPTAQVNA
jgi:hypothetical protein